ncbi:hypothetical protein NKH18_15340 [Streptomyces sp. M10(2022)]
MCDAFAAAGHEVTLYSVPGSGEDPYAYYGVRHRFPIRLVACPDYTPPATGSAPRTSGR